MESQSFLSLGILTFWWKSQVTSVIDPLDTGKSYQDFLQLASFPQLPLCLAILII